MHRCPHCRKLVASTHFLCRFSAKGGKTTGPKKARPSRLARKAALARWRNADLSAASADTVRRDVGAGSEET
jgi:hypothetical protein